MRDEEMFSAVAGSEVEDKPRRENEVLNAIAARATWEDRQSVWYEMRHKGLPRRNKPFKGAADQFFPLIDSTIERMLPFYHNQVFQAEGLAEFGALGGDVAAVAEDAQDAFDWHLREETNFEEEIEGATDKMLESGRGVMKVIWDDAEKRLEITSISPINLIVPVSCRGDLEDADWFVEVKLLTKAQYLRDRRYKNRDAATLKQICGKPDEGMQERYQEAKAYREGLTHTTDEDTIVIWEKWSRTGNGWLVEMFSPNRPERDLKEPYRCPYKYKDNGKPLLPYETFPTDTKDRAWYAPRGLAERLAPFQQACCKCWNDHLDWQTIMNRPYWSPKGPVDVANLSNFRAQPGELLPIQAEPVRMPEPPATFGEQINFNRLTSEQLINLPDFGRGSADDAGKNKTATEVQIAANYSGQGIDLRGKRFRRSLSKFYRKCWALLVQYGAAELTYYVAGERKMLPEAVQKQVFRIRPVGSSEQWNKQLELQKAVNAYQMFKGHPNVNQEELTKRVLRLLDGRWEANLFMATNAKAFDEREDEGLEIILMERGFPAQVKPQEDHATRLLVLMERAEQMDAMGAPPNPQFAGMLQQHIATHWQFFEQADQKGAQAFKAQLEARRQQQALAAKFQRDNDGGQRDVDAV